MALKLLSPTLSTKGRGSSGSAGIFGPERLNCLTLCFTQSVSLSNNTSVWASYWQEPVLLCSTRILIFKVTGEERICLATMNFEFRLLLTDEIQTVVSCVLETRDSLVVYLQQFSSKFLVADLLYISAHFIRCHIIYGIESG